MHNSVAIVGAGVSGLTCAVVLAEHGCGTAIFAEETGQHTTSAAAGAIWYPYDAEPAEQVIVWALETYKVLVDLARDKRSGVSMIELRTFARTGEIQIPEWAIPLGARRLSNFVPVPDRAQRGGHNPVIPSGVEESLTIKQSEIPPALSSGFALTVPLMDTTIYLDYLAQRFTVAGGTINGGVRLAKLEDVSREFDLVVNCAGIGAKTLVHDSDLEAHRGQVAIVPKIDGLTCAIVCDDLPLMYAIPRVNDCVFGGTNEVSDDRGADPAATSRVLAECSRVLNINQPKVLAERVGLRPFRKSGVRVDRGQLDDGRPVIHNYGHGGSGFTLSWGCAQKVLALAGAVVGSV
jgi:D-amino-acid oxidase